MTILVNFLICSIPNVAAFELKDVVHFTTCCVHSMHDVGVNFVLSKDAQKQLA